MFFSHKVEVSLAAAADTMNVVAKTTVENEVENTRAFKEAPNAL